jgi:hypothetical protein
VVAVLDTRPPNSPSRGTPFLADDAQGRVSGQRQAEMSTTINQI